MFRVIYQSTARRPMTPEEIDALVQKSRRRNDACGVTGLLLCVEGKFLQVLEGTKAAVLARFQRIEGDPRHAQVRLLWAGEVAAEPLCEQPMVVLAPDQLTPAQGAALRMALAPAPRRANTRPAPAPRPRRLRDLLPDFSQACA